MRSGLPSVSGCAPFSLAGRVLETHVEGFLPPDPYPGTEAGTATQAGSGKTASKTFHLPHYESYAAALEALPIEQQFRFPVLQGTRWQSWVDRWRSDLAGSTVSMPGWNFD